MRPENLRKWRKRKNFTQAEAAAELCMSLPQYQKWEQGAAPVRGLAEKYITLERAMDDLREKIALTIET